MHLILVRLNALMLLLGMLLAGNARAALEIDGKSYGTLQEALDAHAGRVLVLPAGDYPIDAPLSITKDGSGLAGMGRIIQSSPDQNILEIKGAADVRIKDVTLTRAEGKQDATRSAIRAEKCTRLEISGVQVHENRSAEGSIVLVHSTQSRIDGCLVRNYKRIFLDDRTKKPLYGYAFQAIDGTGIVVMECQAVQVTNNRVLEFNYIPTRENRDQYNLGTLTVVPEKPGRLMDPDILANKYTNNWHQGAGLLIGGADFSDYIQITGNYFENAAQGMDVHGDHVTISGNQINRAMIGMKAVHGCKHVSITSNQFSYCDLWGLLLMPGAESSSARAADGDKPAKADNSDGASVVANNIFSHFGMGDQYWNWTGRTTDYPELNVIAVVFGQLEENPPIRDLLITGNIVYDNGRDQVLVDGKPQTIAPRYHYALYVEQTRQPAPERVVVKDNLFDTGMKAATNLPATD